MKRGRAWRFIYHRTLYAADLVRAGIMEFRDMDRSCVVILGSPRSGTSWLMRLIGAAPGYCTMFEPLHPRWWPGVREAEFGDRPSDGDKRKRQFIQEIFDGVKASRHPRWSYLVNGNPVLFVRGVVQRAFADRLVVKFVRALRLFPWLLKHFPDQQYIYIVRDPRAVVSSQLQTGISAYMENDNNWPTDLLDHSEYSPSLLSELCSRIRSDAAAVIDSDAIHEIKSLEGCLTLSWYSDNLVARRAAEHKEVAMLSYEDLLTDTQNELERLKRHIKSESCLTSNVNVKDTNHQISKWRKKLSDVQTGRIERALNILEETHVPTETLFFRK